LVEAEALALGHDQVLRHAAALAAEHHVGDVPGHGAQHQEHEHRDADQRRDHQRDALENVAEHGRNSAAKEPAGSCRG